MRKRTAASLCLSALLAAAPLAATVVNRTIATVNGEAILLSEFDKNWEALVEQQKGVMPQAAMTPEWEKETKQKLLDQMINDKLLLQEAKKKNLRVNQRDLENGVLQVKSRFLPDDARRQIEQQVQKQLESMPADKRPQDAFGVDLASEWKKLSASNPQAIKVAEDKFKDELNKEGMSQKKFEDRIKDQISVVQLTSQEVRSRTKEPTDDEIRALYDKLLLIMDGKEPKDADPETAADLQSLAGYFKNQTGEQVRARHILVRVDKDAPFKEKAEAHRKIEDVQKKIKGGADFAELAKKISDDKGSAAHGGDLGYFGKGQMVKEFEEAAFKTPVGQVSDIVETPFGFHIIKVEAKKAGNKLAFDDAKADIKEYIYRTKAQQNFEGYIKDIRGKAAVKVVMDPTAEAPKK